MKLYTRLRNHAFEIGIVFFVIALALCVRARLISPVTDYSPGDTHRDFLIASHIVTYHELPLRGPDGYLEGLLPSSPVYYYLAAMVLLIQKSVFALDILNLILQIVFILSVYLLARMLFDRYTAAVSLVAVSFIPGFIDQSKTPWQPTIAQPVLFIGYLFLYRGYAGKKLSATIIGVCLYLFALALGPSTALSIAPMIAVVVALSLRRQKNPWKSFFPLLLISSVVFFVLFALPFWLRVAGEPGIATTWNNELLTQLISGVFQITTLTNLWERALIFSRFFHPSSPLLFIFVSAGVILYRFSANRPPRARRHWTFLLACILQVITLAAIVQTNTLPLPERFFIPIFGLFVIWASESLVGVLRFFAPKVAMLPILVSFVLFSLLLPSYLQKRIPPKTYPEVDALVSEIIRIRESEVRNDYHFFAFRMYTETEANEFEEDEFTEIPLWIQLENRLDTKLVAVADKKLWGYVRIGSSAPPYVFLVCSYLTEQQNNGQQCLSAFANVSGPYVWTRTIFEDAHGSMHVFKNGLL